MQSDFSLYLIADTSQHTPTILLERVLAVIDYGITCVQLRMKHQPEAEIIAIGKILLAHLKPKAIPLIINDHAHLAQAIDADGVHIGQGDMTYPQARAILGPDKIIGLSLRNHLEAQCCKHFNADYFGVGPVFLTNTKTDATPPIGIKHLQQINQLLPKPVVAIGGISEKNLLPVLQTQIAGIAVVSAILSASNPIQATTQLSQMISNYRER